MTIAVYLFFLYIWMTIAVYLFFFYIWMIGATLVGTFMVFCCVPHLVESANGVSVRLMSFNYTVPLEEHAVMILAERQPRYSTMDEFISQDKRIFFLKLWPYSDSVKESVNLVNMRFHAYREKLSSQST